MTVYKTLLALVLVVVCSSAAWAQSNSGEGTRKVKKSDCELAGGTYSEGVNFTRCEYPNGDSYTCNSDVNKCESCTNGKCTVDSRPGGMRRPMISNPPAKMTMPQKTPSKMPVKPMQKQLNQK